MPVKSSFDGFAFLRSILRECVFQVLAHDVQPITAYVIDQRIKQI